MSFPKKNDYSDCIQISGCIFLHKSNSFGAKFAKIPKNISDLISFVIQL